MSEGLHGLRTHREETRSTSVQLPVDPMWDMVQNTDRLRLLVPAIHRWHRWLASHRSIMRTIGAPLPRETDHCTEVLESIRNRLDELEVTDDDRRLECDLAGIEAHFSKAVDLLQARSSSADLVTVVAELWRELDRMQLAGQRIFNWCVTEATSHLDRVSQVVTTIREVIRQSTAAEARELGGGGTDKLRAMGGSEGQGVSQRSITWADRAIGFEQGKTSYDHGTRRDDSVRRDDDSLGR